MNLTNDKHYQCNGFKSWQFVTSQWQDSERVSTLYLIYRWSIALFALSVVISSIIFHKPGQDPGEHWKWFIYATHWSYLIIVFQAFLGVFLVQKAASNHVQPKHIDKAIIKDRLFEEIARNVSAAAEVNDLPQDVNPPSRVPFLLYRISFAAAFDMALAVTAIFWVFIYEPKDDPVDALNILMHAGNSLLMGIEATLVRHAVLWWDVLASLAIGIGFLIFSAIYYLAGGTDHYGHSYIYRIMDWTRWQRTLAFGAGAVLATIMIHSLLMILQVLRKSIHRRWTMYRVRIKVESGCGLRDVY